MADKINIAKPIIEEDEINAVVEVMKSGMIAQGPKVQEFEEKFAEYVNTKYAITTNSGTSALHVSLLSIGIKEGDEVITSPFTFAASGNSILYTGARPVFTDIDPETYTLDPNKIEDAITDKTKAILPVHLYGQPADMDPIIKLAKEYNLKIIEDAAQAHGAEYKNKKIGSIGDAGCFSFYPTKNMTTSEGGMITTNNEEIAENAKIYKAHGSAIKYKHTVLGYNFRMTDIAAAIGIQQLKKIDKFNKKRNENAQYITNGLKDVKEIKTPTIRKNSKHVFHQYTIEVNSEKREKWIEYLTENNIGTGIHYPIPLYKQPLYKKLGYQQNEPETEKASNKVISIPIHPSLTKKDLDTIIQTIKEGSKKL